MSRSRKLPAAIDAVLSRDLEKLKAVRREDVDTKDRAGRTALHHAILSGELSAVRWLVANGADPGAKDNECWTPLHYAAQEHRPDIARSLLDGGALVDAADANGNTPLWRAVFDSRGRPEMIQCLLSYGADRTLANQHGVSPLDLAKTIANYDVLRFLQDA